MRKRKISEKKMKQNFIINLYEKYEQVAYRIAYSVLGNEADAEDVVSETYIKIAERIDKLIILDEDSVGRYLSIMARNIAINLYRRKSYEKKLFLEIDEEWQKKVYITNEQEKQNMNIVKECINSMPPRYKEIILLRCYYEMSFNEIAKKLHINSEAARQRYGRARKMLLERREELSDGTEK